MVLQDELHFDNIEEALNLLESDNVSMPSYLPEGFVFERATFPINPINHPEELRAGKHMFADYSNGEDSIRVMTMEWDPGWGISVFSGSQKDIKINGNTGAIADGMVMVMIGDVLYSIDALSLTQEELIKIAKSL